MGRSKRRRTGRVPDAERAAARREVVSWLLVLLAGCLAPSCQYEGILSGGESADNRRTEPDGGLEENVADPWCLEVRATERHPGARGRETSAVYTYRYDEGGRLISRLRDLEGDGEVDISARYVRRPDGRRTRVERYFSATTHGEPDAVLRFQYDGARRVEKVYDAYGDGDSELSYAYDYDGEDRLAAEKLEGPGEQIPTAVRVHSYEGGARVRTERYRGSRTDGRLMEVRGYDRDRDGGWLRELVDVEADGVADFVFSVQYDERGRKTSEVYNGGDEGVWQLTTYEYDDEGRLVGKVVGDRPIGAPDGVIRYEYEEGRRVRMEEDSTFAEEETSDKTVEFELANGRRIHIEPSERDADDPEGPDGVVDRVVEYEHEKGRLTAKKYDENADGMYERIERFDYENGRRVERTTDGGEFDEIDGVPTAVTDFVYEDGTLVRKEYDLDRDGEPEETSTYDYDDRGRRVREKLDGVEGRGFDGETDVVVHYEYDEDGRRIRSRREEKYGAGPAGRIEYEYENGRRRRRTLDFGSDGELERIVEYEFDTRSCTAPESLSGAPVGPALRGELRKDDRLGL